MGSKYTTQAASGYNSSPPSDDGAQTASNLITWAKHKTKLADPVKNLADAMNTALVSAFDYSVRQITGSDSTIASDHMKCVEIAPTVTTAVTVSLGDATTMTSNYRVFVKNSSARNQTLGLATGTDTLDGTAAGTITLPPKSGVIVQTNSTAVGYLITARYGTFPDGEAVVSGGTDGTKKIRFEVDGLTAATTRVLTIQDADHTLVGRDTTETLTNKTLTTPVFSGTPTGTVTSGTYTPTLTSTANTTTITSYAAQYMRVGNTVTVSGKFTATASNGAVVCQLRISLPIASNFGNDYECGGAGGVTSGGDNVALGIEADATNDTAVANFLVGNSSAHDYAYTFTYQVI